MPLSARVMAPAPALMLELPVTVRPPAVSLMAPPLLEAVSAPDTVPVPRFNAPLDMAVRSPVVTLPSDSWLLPVIWVAAPVSVAAPWKSLLASVRVMAPVPALMEEAAVTVRPPRASLILPELLEAFSAPVTEPVPRFRSPVEVALRLPVCTVARVRAFRSEIWVAPPVSVTGPWKSLPALFKVIVWPVAVMLEAPFTVRAPVWVTGPVALTLREPVLVAAKLVAAPLLVRLVSGVVPPTAPAKPMLPEPAVKLRACAPSTVFAKLIGEFTVVSVVAAPRVTLLL